MGKDKYYEVLSYVFSDKYVVLSCMLCASVASYTGHLGNHLPSGVGGFGSLVLAKAVQ